jgi:hypothetical protein
MCPIRLTELDDWVYDAATGRGDLPIYGLRAPNDLPPLDSIVANFRTLGFTAERRRDSGIIEARTQQENNSRRMSPQVVEAVVSAASDEDSREYLHDFDADVPPETLAERQFLSFHTELDSGVPVIGPGGRVSMFRTSTSIWIDITVRQKSATYSSRLRELRNICQPYRDEFAGWEKQVEVEPLFGYFELSKYETQLFLRPVFVFIFSVSASAEGAVSWQTVRVEPATLRDEIPPRAGLGHWYSLGGGNE